MESAVTIASYLIQIIASKLGVDESEINVKRPFFSIGVSSLISEEIRSSLCESFDNLSSTLLFEHPSIERLSSFLATLKPVAGSPLEQLVGVNSSAKKSIKSPKKSKSASNKEQSPTAKAGNNGSATTDSKLSDIAIIGIAGKFPKAATPAELWKNLLNKTDCVSEIPQKRWNAEQLYQHLEKNGLSISGKWGGFIDDIEYFDPLFFQIPHREAEIMDPQQKLFLQCGWELMEDAGYANSDFRGTDKIGVYVGVTWNEFSVFARDETLRGADYKGAGTLYWSIPNRLSYFLNLGGPSVAIDTACSSSLVAIHDACQAIQNGDCELAIAGGINLNLHPAKYQFLSQNHFLSSDGRCRSFGDGGDGYVPSEGVAAILLKPLQHAEKDGDQIYGVIKGTATNHGGKVTGYTVPNPVAHTEVIARAIERAQCSADQISFIECHGTGTDLGDPIEITGLAGVFDKAKVDRQFCAIGSLKSNIGHLEAAAGIAGLIKVLLSMQAKQLPASLHSTKENKKLKLDHSAFRLVKENEPWGVKGETLLAGISSFGAGGSNAHLIVQNYHAEGKTRSGNDFSPQVFVLSAESRAQLEGYADKMLAHLVERTDKNVNDICFSLLTGRSHFSHRLAIIAASIDELVQKLKHFCSQKAASKEQHDKTSGLFVGVVQAGASEDFDIAAQADNWNTAIHTWSGNWVEGKAGVASLRDQFPEYTQGARVSLPTYPFLKEWSWLRPGYPLVPLMEGLSATDLIHPLIDKNTSTIYTQSFSKTFDVSEFVLKDHLVNDVHVIPGVCHLEMARISAERTLLDKVVELKDVWFTNVISVRESREVEVQLQIEAEELGYRIWDPKSEAAFSRGKISWPEEPLDQQSVLIDLDLMHKSMTEEWSIPDVYRKFVATGIIQKQSFQVLQKMQFNGNRAISRLSLPANLQENFNQFGFHPALMDGIVQTAMMHVQYLADNDVKILPFHFSSVKLLKPMEQDVYVISKVLDFAKKQFDLTLCNVQGEILVEVSNFILREMKAETAYEEQTRKHSVELRSEQNVSSNADSNYYAWTWQKVGETTHSHWSKLSDERSILVVNPVAEAEAGIAKRFKNSVFASQAAVQDQKNRHFYLDLANLEQVKAMIDKLEADSQLPELVVYLASQKQQEPLCGEVLFLLAKTLIPKSAKIDFAVLNSHTEPHERALLSAATGFFKTLNVEKPGFRGRVIEFSDNQLNIENRIACALTEIKDFHSAHHVRYTDGTREEKRFRPLSVNEPTAATSTTLRQQGVYLITGGMGGIGLVFARYLLTQFNATVFLSGRSAMDAEKEAVLKSLADKGGKAHYLVCDVASKDDVTAACANIIERCGVLHGVVHSAGVIEDGFILRKDQSAFRKVIAPKIQGTLNLDAATKNIELDFFCLFSSVTSILGNLGQCDYGYANAFVDSFSSIRHALVTEGKRNGKSLAINWPYWKNGGMQLSDKEEAILTQTFGFVPLENAAGLKALVDGLNYDYAQIAVLEGDHDKIQQVLGIKAPAVEDVRVVAAANAGDTETIKSRAVEYLKALFSKELKIPADRIDGKSSFEKYGFDSIVMIDLINLMEKKFKRLPKTLFFEYHTLDQLAGYFASQHAEHFSSSVAQDKAVEKGDETSQALAARVLPAQSGSKDNPENTKAHKPNRFAALINKNQATQKTPSVFVSKAPLKREVHKDSIAIVGLAGRYPDAENVDALWQNLVVGKDSVREVPESLWDWKEFYREGKPQAAKSYSKWGGFLTDVDQFDARYFNISPKEAETMDPQERLFLQAATHAIQDAGYTAANLARVEEGSSENPVGVFVGVMWGDYQLYGVQSSDPDQWTTPRSFYWAIANRLSYFYNFSGPSMAIDTACSSSLTALHLACESLRRGEINAAIAGGVNLTLHPNKYNLLSEMQFLSTDGRCRSFGEGGDGYVPGDGVGAVVLKRLADAEADGDHIYAVVRGTSINHGGKTSGFTVPNPHRQAALVKEALDNAGVNPRQVSYVEAHGTGTSLGDPVEMIGLQKAYNQNENNYCAIGSIKSNIGHLEAAAGVAALTKVLLQFKHRKIAPSIHSANLNSNINFDSTPFYVQREPGDWHRPQFRESDTSDAIIEIPRIAGISSFGAGGSNAHVILQEYISENIETYVNESPDGRPDASANASTAEQVFVLSAHTLSALKTSAHLLKEALNTNTSLNTQASLKSVAYTLQLGREALDERVAVLARDKQGLINALDDFIQGNENPDWFQGTTNNAKQFARLFGGDQDVQQLVDNWVSTRALKSLANAWVSGMHIPWEKLHDLNTLKRVSLPGYPFETRRYWTPLPEVASQRALHPLIDENQSSFERVVFSKTYTGTELIVVDHQVFNKPTLPGTAQLAMALQSLELSGVHVGETLQIRDVRWEKPLQITNGAIAVECELVHTATNQYVFETGYRQHESTTPRIACVQGTIAAVSARANATVTDFNAILNAAKNNGLEFSGNQINKAMTESGFIFGDNFLCHESVYLVPGKAVAKIKCATADQQYASAIPPITLDAALRTSLLVDAAAENRLSIRFQLPIAIEQLTLHLPVKDEYIYAIASKTVGGNGAYANDESRFDIDILDTKGNLLASLSSLQTKLIDYKPRMVSEPVVSKKDALQSNDKNNRADSLKVEQWLKKLVADTTKLDLAEITADVALEKYGIDSVMVMTLNDKLEAVFGELSKTLFYEYQNLASLAAYFCKYHVDIVQANISGSDDSLASTVAEMPVAGFEREQNRSRFINLEDLRKRRTAQSATGHKAIAVIGLSGRYPKAGNVQEFWRNLLEGKDCIEEIPPNRWNADVYFEAGTIETGKSSGRWGGFIEKHDCFDAALFKILPDQACKMDPQERLFLQTIWSTLEDAGYSPSAFSHDGIERNVGVFAGSMWNHYSHFGLENTVKGLPDVTYGWDASIANRVSYFFDFHGPSMMVDTACSSSLLAIHHACESLLKGSCKYAIAGGVNLSIHPYKYSTLTQMQMLSSDGRCKSFGAGGDGYVPGEGVGAVLLKPLDNAIADSDQIYAVITGSASNHNGKTNGFTVPNPHAQEAGIQLALQDAGLSVNDLSYFEAHGTGTRLGDPIEFNALNSLFKNAHSARESCALGSVKSNVGHLEGAAGIVALTKVLLQLKHKRLVPSLHSKELNPNLSMKDSALYIPQQVREWHSPENTPRRAAISSLGAGGANAFLVVEEFHPRTSRVEASAAPGKQLILLSAKNQFSLRANAEQLLALLESPAELNFADLAFTLQVGRVHLEHRVCLVATDRADCIAVLKEIVKDFDQNEPGASRTYRYASLENISDRSWWPTEYRQLESLAEHDPEFVAQAWISGQLDDRTADWKSLHKTRMPARMSLPTYVFDEQPYWTDNVADDHAAAGIAATAISPLLDTNSSTFHWQYYRKTFRATDAIVAAHVVGGNKIIAGSVLLEMALTAAQNSMGLAGTTQSDALPALQLTNLSWQHAARLADKPLEIGVLLFPSKESAHFSILPTDIIDGVIDGSFDAEAAQQTVFVSGDITFTPGRPLNRHIIELLLARLQPLAENKADIYRYYQNLGLNYGTYFQVTHSVYVGKRRALAILESDDSAYPYAHKILSPAIADGALRTALLAITSEDFSGSPALANWSQLLVPHSIENLGIYATIPQKVFCLIELVDVDIEFQTYAVLNISLMDSNGYVCAELKHFRAVVPGLDFYRANADDKLDIWKKVSSVPAIEPAQKHNGPVLNELHKAKTTSAKEIEPRLHKFLKDAFSRATGINTGDIQFDKTFDAIGVDSITIVKLNRILDSHFRKLSKTLFFECKSLADVHRYLLRKHHEDVVALADTGSSENQALVRAGAAPVVNDKPVSASALRSDPVFVQAVRHPAPLDSHHGRPTLAVALMGHWSDAFRSQLPFESSSVLASETFSREVAGQYHIDFGSRTDFTELFSSLRDDDRLPDVICFKLDDYIDYGFGKDCKDSPEAFKLALAKTSASLLYLIQGFSRIAPEKSLRIICAFQSFGANRQPHFDALDGLSRALKDISSHIHLSLLRLHPGLIKNEVRYLECLENEIASRGEQSNVLEYDARGRRYHYILQETSSRFSERSALPLKEGGVYLITGGAGAIGSVLARYLRTTAEKQSLTIKVVLLGRSEINERIAALVSELNSARCEVSYQALDILDYPAVEQTLSRQLSINGIFHCAGVSANKALLGASYEEFSQPLAVKCTGTVNLDVSTATQPLDFFILFSSITAQIGDFGAGGYATGNAFLDHFSPTRNLLALKGLRHGKTLSIAWPLWDLDGIQQDEDLVETWLQAYGLEKISAAQALEVLEKAWHNSSTQTAFYFGNKQHILDHIVEEHYRPVEATNRSTVQQLETLRADVSKLTRYLKKYQQRAVLAAGSLNAVHADVDIAIIGLSGRYPQAATLQDFWKNLCEGRDCITEIPGDRWDFRQRYSSDRANKGKIYGKWGGFIDDVDMFDAQYFNISPREAELLDPQERIFLQASLHCLDDAGYTRESLAQTTVGVYVGVMWGQYQLFDVTEDQLEYGLPGSSFSAIPNRVSYYFDFNGPSIALDTMCSSSLTALHSARLAILNGECDYALAGGVNLSLHEKKYQLLSQGQFLSSDGRCRTFGEGGDGYVPGEGVGVVLLKRLDKAVADGDHIYGVFKASAVNHGGRANGFTVPNPSAQQNVIEKALSQTGWNPETISYLEAHGTGTSLGDPIEITGLQNAFEKLTENKQFCAIGSVKSNIGHLESAAGMAGLTKVLLQLKHKKLVPSLHSDVVNSNIDFEATAFRVSRETAPWTHPIIANNNSKIEYPLRAGVSSFGAGGSNAHILLEEYDSVNTSTSDKQQSLLFLFSARTEQRLHLTLKNFSKLCAQQVDSPVEERVSLRDLAFTLMVGREQSAERVAILASNFSDLQNRLDAVIERKKTDDLYRGGEQQSTQLNMVLSSEQRRDLIADFVSRKDLSGMAGAWVAGISIDWLGISRQLFSGDRPRRVSLPVTPLIPVRFRVQEARVGGGLLSTQGLHPLIDENKSTLFQQAYTKVFTGEEFYLADHIIGIRKPQRLLPGVAYIEMLRAAAELALSSKARVTGIKDLLWLKPISEQQLGRTITILLGESEGRFGFEVLSENGGELETHAHGAFIFDTGLEQPQFDISGELRECVSELGEATINRCFGSIGYHDGEAFKATRQVYFNQTKAVSRLILPACVQATAADFSLHPSLMDAALRTCLFIGGIEAQSSTIVPFAVDEIAFFGSLPEECFAVAELDSEAPGASSALRRYAVSIVDNQGRCLLTLRGFSAREIPIESGQSYIYETHYFRRRWVSSPLPEQAELANLIQKPVLVIGEQTEIFIKKSGFSDRDYIAIEFGKRFKERDANNFVVSKDNNNELTSVLRNLQHLNRLPTNIVLLLPDDRQKLSRDTLDKALETNLLPVVGLFKCLNELQLDAQIKLLCCYPLSSKVWPVQQALSAFAKSMVQINHKIGIAVLGLDNDGSRARLITTEFANDKFSSGLEIRYKGIQRELSSFEKVQVVSKTRNPIIVDGQTWLITGGAGQLGQIFARYLIQRYHANIVLTGRSEENTRIREIVGELATETCRVRYVQSDISQRESIESLLADVQHEFGEISGIVHSAGVVDERKLTELDNEGFLQTLTPKVHGLLNLYELASEHKIAHILCFSSVSSFLGDFGGGSYAFGNRFMDAFAASVPQKSAPHVISIDWPLWLDGGMELPESQQAFYRRTGIHPINETQGLSALEDIIDMHETSVVVCAGPLTKILKTLGISSSTQRNAEEKQLVPLVRVQEVPKALSTISTISSSDNSVTAESPRTENGTEAALLSFILAEMATVLKMSPAAIDHHSRFESFGMDSVMLMEFNKKLGEKLPGLPKTTLFEYDSVKTLHQHLKARYQTQLQSIFPDAQNDGSKRDDFNSGIPTPVEKQVNGTGLVSTGFVKKFPTTLFDAKPSLQKRDTRIAVIGLGSQFPLSDTPESFWKNILEANNCLREIPADRWQADLYYSSDNTQFDDSKTCSKWGGFIDRVNWFDAEFFKMSDREAAALDPQLRLMLKVAWQAVEDAAYAPASLKDIPFGVFVGVMNSDYAWIASDLFQRTGQYPGPGSFASEIANRISWVLNVTGPSLTVETACASSSTAIHLARKAIMDGECEMALAGGVNLSLHPGKYLMLDQMKVLSPDGIEKTFDADANGLVPGEGVGAVVLKSYEKAVADGDHIYGVISGSALGHSGVGPALNLPSVQAMEKTVAAAIEEAGISGEQLAYIESHGTGTELGDPIELKALVNALKRYGNTREYCAIGCKSNFGHLESASGVCSLIKVLLAFKHDTIPPCGNISELTPAFDKHASPLYFPSEPKAFSSAQNGKRYAGINSFGLGGSNAFMIVESHAENFQSSTVNDNKQAFIFSAPDKEQLNKILRRFTEHCENSPKMPIDQVAFSLQTGRNQYRERFAVVTENLDIGKKIIQAWLSGQKDIANAYAGNTLAGKGLCGLLSGAEGEAFISSGLASGNLGKLCELWVSGGDIPWRKLHSYGTRRCSLPTYPFNEKEHSLLLQIPVVNSTANKNSENRKPEIFISESSETDVIVNKVIPESWYKTTELNNSYFIERPVEILDIQKTLTKKLRKQLPEVEQVVFMTPVQESKYRYFSLKSSTELVKQVALTINGELECQRLMAAWWKVARKASVLRSVFVNNRKGHFRVVLKDEIECLASCFTEFRIQGDIQSVFNEAKELSHKEYQIPYEVRVCRATGASGEVKTCILWSFPEYVMHTSDAMEILRKVYRVLNSKNIHGAETGNDSAAVSRMLDVVECKETVKNYWLTRLKEHSSAKPLAIENEAGDGVRDSVMVTIGKNLTRKLQKLTQEEKIEFDVVLAAAWSVIQARETKSSHAMFALSGKFKSFESEEALNGCGIFESRVPMLVKTQVRMSIREWLHDIQAMLEEKRKYAHIPYETIQKWLNVQHLACCTLSVKDASVDVPETDMGWGVEEYLVNENHDTPVAVVAVLKNKKIDLSIEYPEKLFAREKMALMLQYLEVVFESIVANSNRNPAAISLMTKQEYSERFWGTLEREKS